MATFMDISLLGHIQVIFIFLLVFAIMYAILTKTKVFGNVGNGIYAIISLAVAVLVAVSSNVVKLVGFLAPWFIIVVILAFFIIFVFRMYNVGEDKIAGALSKNYIWVIIPCIVIFIFGMSNVFGQNLLEEGGTAPEGTGDTGGQVSGDSGTSGTGSTASGQSESTATGSFQSNFVKTLFHPKILGLFFLLIIAMFAIIFLTGRG